MYLIAVILLSLFTTHLPEPEPASRTLLYFKAFSNIDPAKVPVDIKDSLHADVEEYQEDRPEPIHEIHYEGLLDTNPLRVKTLRHLEDMDKIYAFYWHHALFQDKVSLEKMKDFCLAWVDHYQPNGNPINENKLLPVVYAYSYLYPHLGNDENKRFVAWLDQLGSAGIAKKNIPLNNWETKRINLVGTIGLLTGNQGHLDWALDQARYYIDNALFSDGSSTDIKSRDALSYHVSALKPLLQFLITLESFDKEKGKTLFDYKSDEGASLSKSLDYVLPYAKGEKVYYQWRESKVKLDHERAEAGLEKYQPGTPYRAEEAYETMALASYFHKKYRMEECDSFLCRLIGLEIF